MNKYPTTFTPLKIGSVTLKNRLVQGPVSVPTEDLTDNLTPDGAAFLVERAKGGFGLVIQTAAWADMEVEGLGPGFMMTPLRNPAVFMSRCGVLTEKIHSYGAKIFCQVTMGMGRNVPGLKAASRVPDFFMPDQMHEALTVEEIQKKIQYMAQTAAMLKNAGYDGVEVHAMHWGYLIDQFAMALTNQRDDQYGGSLENRVRVCKEIVEAIKAACGQDFPVTMKMGLKSFIKGFNQPTLDGADEAGRTLEESIEIAKLLESYGYDALHVNAGIYDSYWKALPTSYEPKGKIMELAKELKKHVSIPVIVCGRMNDPELIESVLADGQVDGVVMSRGGIADADFPHKMEAGRIDEIRPCLACSVGCNGRAMATGKPACCAVNPAAGREETYALTPAVKKKKVVVVGGGAAGMEAARVAKLRGHDVEVYEKSDVLGGHLVHTGQHDFKQEVAALNKWYQKQLELLEIPVHMNTAVDAELLKSVKPDAVILAVGSYAIMPKWLEGVDHEKSVSCIDALMGNKPVGQNVVIVGGGMTGCELGYDLAREGKKVQIVEMAPDILMAGPPMPIANGMHLRMLLGATGVELLTSTKIAAINDEGAVVETADGEKKTLPADTVILAMGLRPENSLAADLRGEGMEIFEIGDGRQVVNIMNAVWDGYEVAKNL
ncbi:MAG: FAD-dependent oxidoreductase [Oscillospiraceae bacterium]|nr:FAD-dependent oxidoreductase [Oscillospiraceae bacterium]